MLNRATMNERMAEMYQEAGDIKAASSILGGVTQGGMFAAKAGMFKPSYWNTPATGRSITGPSFQQSPLGIGIPKSRGFKMNETFLFPRQRMT